MPETNPRLYIPANGSIVSIIVYSFTTFLLRVVRKKRLSEISENRFITGAFILTMDEGFIYLLFTAILAGCNMTVFY
jgi:hypothetical protein